MNTISFMTANYVARQLDFNMTRGWGQGEKATHAYFRPVETFGARFEEMLQIIRASGYEAIDLWLAHLSGIWATDAQIRTACDLLRKYKLKVVSLAGWLGSTAEEFEATCKLSVALDCKILGASTSMLDKDRAFVVRTLQKYDLQLGIENHPEKNAEELLAKIGDGGAGTIGACVDTGWFGTQGYDAAQAIEKLNGHLFHIHLKDVLHTGEPHDTCRFGQGIVPVAKCVQTLKRLGYQGAISVEHEPEHFDPTEDCKAGLAMLKEWLE